MSARCEHDPREVPGSTSCYMGPVAVAPYTDENRAAHGGVQVTESCARCGALRKRLVNGCHSEEGPWGPSRGERERREREAAARERAAREADEDRILGARGLHVADVRCDDWDQIETVLVTDRDGAGRWTAWHAIQDAARQCETGDGLPQVYRAIYRQALQVAAQQRHRAHA